MKTPITLFKPVLLASCISLAACGGSGGSDPDTAIDPVSILSGTAAAGAAIIGTVTVKGALGLTNSTLIEADGNYNVDVTGLTAPYRLRAQGTVGGKTYKLHSYAEEADVGGNVNITPFTDLIIANAAQQIAASYFDDDVLDDTEALDPDVLAAQETALQEKLQDVLSALGVDTAIDLLNSTFSADHSGLDAALDIIQIESTTDNIVTITNLLDSTTISDDILDTEDTGAFIVAEGDVGNYTEAVSDTVAIATLFEDFSALFIGGLPSYTDAEAFLAADFLLGDTTSGEFLTEITTDPSAIDLAFTGISISNLDSVAGTATVKFNVIFGGQIDSETETWFVAFDATLGWQLRGDQRIVDLNTLMFHCNDYDGTDGQPGACGINVSFWDENFDNNGTNGAAIASGTATIIGADGIVKDTVYLGTADFAGAGEVMVYNEATGEYQGDWKEFGSTGLGDIDPAIFAVGDIIEYKLYTADLDISTTSTPFVVGTEVATYSNTLLFTPSTTGLYPTATAATITALENFTLGNNLSLEWTLQDGTSSDEVLVEISDDMGNRIEIWDESFDGSTTSITIASTQLDSTAASAAGLDSQALTYNLMIRIYATDVVTGQEHSTDYRATIDGPAAETGGTDPVTTLTCNTDSGWNDALGEPVTFYSFVDFQTVVADCGGAFTTVDADVIGTWVDSYTETDGAWVETILVNADGTGNYSETLNGSEMESIDFTWTLTNDLFTITVSNFFTEIWALTSTGIVAYAEAADWSSTPDITTFDSTAEGEIWYPQYIKQ